MTISISQLPVFILCGGKGTRLKSVVADRPKPMALIDGRPFLEFLLIQLKRQNFRKFVFLTGYKASMVEDYFGDGQKWQVEIQYSQETTPLGTGGAVAQAFSQYPDFNQALVLNGDSYFDISYSEFLTALQGLDQFSPENTVGMTLRYMSNVDRYGRVTLDQNLTIQDFIEKGAEGDGLINGGIYYLPRNAISAMKGCQKFSLETDLFPQFLGGPLVGIPLGGRFIDIGIPKDYQYAQKHIEAWSQQVKGPCLFLDRDGIINSDVSYLARVEDLSYFPEIFELVKWANENNILVIILTNQAGIAKGHLTEEQLFTVMDEIFEEFKRRQCVIDDWYFCPYHQEGVVKQYRQASYLRKPNPGMALMAMEKQAIDWQKSLMVGDKMSDHLDLPGAKTILLRGQYPLDSNHFKGKIVSNHRELLEEVKLFFQKILEAQ